MQNVIHIAPNAGHTAQNDGWTMQNDGWTMQNDGRTMCNVGRNTHIAEWRASIFAKTQKKSCLGIDKKHFQLLPIHINNTF